MIWFVTCRVLALSAAFLGLVSMPEALSGDPWSAVVRPGGIPLGVHLDLVSCLLLAFVGLLGWVVSRYSLTNLRGRQAFTGSGIRLFAALAGLLLTVSGASLVTVAIGWTFSGHAVAALIARSGTDRATAATQTMRRTLLIGDVFLWAGVILAAFTLPSLERSRMTEINGGWDTTFVVALLLVACVARTGLVPAHRWLPETAEAPSPISGLLHAGVVNGTGVLVVLFWPLFSAAPQLMLVLVVLGVTSVVVGGWASRVRADVKGRLACSTTSQMGYMCIELGLGLPGAALLHLIGHGAYKSWLFLRAGGTVARTRRAAAPHAGSGVRPAWAGFCAGALTVVLILPAALVLLRDSGVTAVAAMALAIFAAVLAGRSVADLGRVGPRAVWSVTAASGVAAGAYVWLLLGVEELLGLVWTPEPLWGPATGTLILLALIGAGVLVSRGFDRLEAEPASSLAVRLLPTALPPSHRSRRKRVLQVPTRTPACTDDQMAEVVVVSAIVAAASVVGPAWPLRNFVAANPLTHLEPLAFQDALSIIGRAHGVTGRATLGYFVDLYAEGRITTAQLRSALAEEKPTGHCHEELSIASFEDLSRRLATVADRSSAPHRSFRSWKAKEPAHGSDPARQSDLHSSVWAQRGWGLASTDGPWELWLNGAAHRSYDRAVGISGAAAFARSLPRDPAAAIIRLATVLNLSEAHLVSYFVAMFASAPGWTGHASWRSRRTHHIGPLVELAAMRMAHDALFAPARPMSRSSDTDSPTCGTDSRFSLTNTLDTDQDDSQELVAFSGRVWQRALEISVEERLLPALTHAARSDRLTRAGHGTRPASQSIWCIDVRSEPVRRRLEALGNHLTYGYAGFFGAAVRQVDADGVTHELCPGLIEPAFDSEQAPSDLTVRQVLHRTVTAVSRHPLGALAVAEGGGLVAAGASTLSVLDPLRMRRITRTWTRGSSSPHQVPVLRTELDVAARADLVEAALRATGLTDDFAPVLVFCAHGASPENNAFATAYDCGACGGNDGVVNATLLVDALNDPNVRAVLAVRGLHLPEDTVAVVALHDTTTDSVDLLPSPDRPLTESLRSVGVDLREAGAAAAQHRGPTLPNHSSRHGERPLARRAADWSEPTPEWGLAGNAAIVIGPRDLTTSIDLHQRVFLHSYDRENDPHGTILEQLLTAPLVVAQWINAQYYFSAVAPGVFGAGDKTTHNVVGDVGVLSGAHGDLRTGLPWQALFRDQPGTVPDAGNLMHEPVRLLAVVAADPQLICDVVSRHETLSQLVVNEWIHLVCLDGSRTHRLQTDLTWRPWQTSAQDETGAAKVG